MNDKEPGFTVPDIISIALKAAQEQIGQAEKPKGSNSGPMVDKYLQSVGLKPGFAWCQAFVYWCYEYAADQLNKDNPVPKTGGVQDCWNKAPQSRKILAAEARQSVGKVQPGDQLILLFGRGVGHTGIVEKIDGPVIYTIEGNSNTNGSREGFEVVRHERSINDAALQGFIRYA